jgi:hypothetical protein
MSELHAVLLGVDEGEDVVFGTFQDAFEDCEIRYNTARIEVLGAVEDYLVTFGSDLQVTVAWVDSSSDKLLNLVRYACNVVLLQPVLPNFVQ